MADKIYGLKDVVKSLRSLPSGVSQEVWAKRYDGGLIILWTGPAGEDTCFQRGPIGRVYIGRWTSERPTRYGKAEPHSASVTRAVKRIIGLGGL